MFVFLQVLFWMVPFCYLQLYGMQLIFGSRNGEKKKRFLIFLFFKRSCSSKIISYVDGLCLGTFGEWWENFCRCHLDKRFHHECTTEKSSHIIIQMKYFKKFDKKLNYLFPEADQYGERLIFLWPMRNFLKLFI